MSAHDAPLWWQAADEVAEAEAKVATAAAQFRDCQTTDRDRLAAELSKAALELNAIVDQRDRFWSRLSEHFGRFGPFGLIYGRGFGHLAQIQIGNRDFNEIGSQQEAGP